MKRITINERISIDCTPDDAFDFSSDISQLPSFVGYGPVPGIERAEYEGNSAPSLGARRLIMNRDGTRHRDTCIHYDKPARYVSVLHDFEPPFSLIVRSAEDAFLFSEGRNVTEIQRAFTIELTSLAAYPAAIPLVPFVRKAIQLNLRNIKTGIELGLATTTRSAARRNDADTAT